MKLLINGSGVRRSEVELTDCELKDLCIALKKLLEGCQHGLSAAGYGCVQVEIAERKGGQQ